MIVASEMSLIFFRGQIRYLRAAGFDVTCISSPGAGQEMARVEGAKVVPLGISREMSPGKDLIALFRLWVLLRRIRPEIVNFGTPKGGLLGGVAAWLAGVPHRVYTLHGLRLETARGWQRQLLMLTERVACACAHRIRAVSPSLRDRAVKLRLAAAERIYVLGAGSANGVDTERFRATDARRQAASLLRVRLQIAADAPVVGFVGRITRDKGINELDQAFIRLKERYPKLVLVLIGSKEGACKADEELILRWQSDPQVRLLDAVTELSEYFLLMDVLVLPTYREGLPNVPLEAQAMGVPVVTTYATGARDAVRDGVTGILVPIADVDGIVNATEVLLRDSALRADMGRAGRSWMESTFSCDAAWRLIAQDYRGMLVGESLDGSLDSAEQRTFYSLFGKRLFDLVVSLSMLLILSPAFIALFLLVRVALGSPVIFRQERPGRDGQSFTLMKFRSMTNLCDEKGRPLCDATRLTGFGRLLRSTSMDELPELINIVRGEMSLVGPRPLLVEYMPLYSAKQKTRHRVRPGLTGWAQVNGRNRLNWQARLEMDVAYARQPTFLWDLRILAMTLKQMFLREDVTHGTHATMPKFRGAESD